MEMHESRSSPDPAALARSWRIILPFAIVTPLVAFVLTASKPATYESSADILSTQESFLRANLQNYNFYYRARLIWTHRVVARLPSVAEKVVAAAGVQDKGPYGFLAQSSVDADGSTDVMTFRVRDADPAEATRLATIYAQEYIRHRRALDTRSIRNAIRVVDRELDRARLEGRDPAIYADLVQQQQQLHTALASVRENAVLLRPGSEAVRIAPQPRPALIRGFALGLIMGIGLAALGRLLDPRAKSAEDISEQLDLPLLGRLPLENRSSRRRGALATLRRDDSPYVDAIQLLRTSLELDERAQGQRVLMVTSAVAGEGKSTTTANLAVALARAGRDVVLLELDVRRPSLARLFGIPPGPGVTDALLGGQSIDTFVHVIPLGESRDGLVPLDGRDPDVPAGVLRVVAAGAPVSTDSSQIVTEAGVASLLAEIRAFGEIVLVDSPQVLQSSDTLALSAHADAVLFVAHMRRYRRRHSSAIRRALAMSPALPLGLIVIGDRREFEYDSADARVGRRTPSPDTYVVRPA
jgi:Mrp family chromosome partitioning ATPase/capsular polysaccharide biosynthesis protein